MSWKPLRRRDSSRGQREILNAGDTLAGRNLSSSISGKGESGKLPVTGIEIERDFFDGLDRGWRIFPSHYGLRSILCQDRVAAFDLYLRNGPIGKHGRADPDLSFKMAVLQNRRVFGIIHDNNFAMGFGSALSAKLRNAASNQTKQQGNRKEATTAEAAGTASRLKKLAIHEAIPRIRVETWRIASCGKTRSPVMNGQDYRRTQIVGRQLIPSKRKSAVRI